MGDDGFIKIGPAGSGVITELEKQALRELLYGEADYAFDDVEFDERAAWDEKGRGRIAQIFIWHSKQGINSIQFQFADRVDGYDRLVISDRHGTCNGTEFDVVKLNFPTEHISWISGYTNFSRILSSLTFGTSSGCLYGPFGRKSADDEKFNFRVGEGNEFGGFYGAFNKRILTAIGFYLKPNTT